MDKQTDVQRMAIALANAEPVKAEIPAYNAFVLCGLLQLALRHPALLPGTPNYEIAMLMIKDLKEVLGGIDPYLGELIERGENPDNDVSIFQSGGVQDIN